MVVSAIVMMVVVIVIVVVMTVIVGGTVRPAFWLKSCLDFLDCGSEPLQHFFNHMVRANVEGVFANLRGEMAISKMPSQSHQLMSIFVTDFHQRFGSGGDPEPGSVVELESIAVGHGDRLWKIQQDVPAVVCGKANAPSMTGVEIEGQSAGGLFFRPLSRGAMNGCVAHGDPQYRK
jgi:hypothetical protein